MFLPAILCAAAAVWLVAAKMTLEDTQLTLAEPTALSQGWSAKTDNGTVELSEASRPAAGCVGVLLRLENTLPETLPGSSTLAFQTKNESVRVWVDDELVYSYGETPQRAYGFGVGAVWNIAPLPEGAGGKSVSVELVPIGGSTGLAPYEFLLASRGDVVSYLAERSLLRIVMSAVLSLIGVCSLLLAAAFALKGDSRLSSAVYFGLFVLLAAVWMITDSGLLQFLIPNKGVSYLMFGCSFYLLCSPLALFMAEVMPEQGRLFRGLSTANSLYALLRITLYVRGAVNFESGLWQLHLLMAAIILVFNVTLWRPVIRGGRFEQPELGLAVSVFTLVEGVSLVSFYLEDKLNVQRNGYSSGFYVGVLLFVFITLAGVIKRARQVREQAFKAQFFERRAYTDELTGLLNTKGFDDKCAELLKTAPAEQSCAVVDFDVNFFSQYNASNGLEAGDALLKRIAAELSRCCRDDELFARQEADHFVCLLRGESFSAILERLRREDAAVRRRMTAHKLLLSYGAVEVLDRSLSVAELRNQALVAKRTVKGNYERNIAIYDRSLHEAQLQEVEILSGFERALANDEYVIFLQPKIAVATEKLGGAEALVRHIAPDGSVISAGPIIEALESKGFVAKLDFYILGLVCKFLRRCLDEGRRVCPVSSNFSRVHLYDPDFASRVAEIVNGYNIPHELVEIELTESAFLAGKDVLQFTARRLHDFGFQVSVDDFGSGYSSLNMLKDVDVDTIKLDRGFLADFAENPRAGTVIEHTLRLAQEMKINCVAEGIESAEQLEFLRRRRCDYVQGYYYSRPLPVVAFVEKYLPIERAAKAKGER